MSEKDGKKERSFISFFLQGDWAVVVDDSRVEMRPKTENKSSSVRFIRTRAEESSDLVEERSDSVLVTRIRAEERSDLVEESSDLVDESSPSVFVTRTRAEERSDCAEESSVKFTMETNPP